ncbi:hypothetical protein EFY79_04725 [Hanamia caeni]|uniref:Uncharacterized protein n=1 Tax=Hanamia caeni TaxID=2294116 RepID=A0A3M9NNQ3_9BACT|nr:hypothetical protein EFY79_04725 [Hanamia caeni]
MPYYKIRNDLPEFFFIQLIKKRMFDNNSVVANFISVANALSEEETSQVRRDEITKFLEVF